MAEKNEKRTQIEVPAAYPADWDAGMKQIDDVTNQRVIALVGNGSINARSVVGTLYRYLVEMAPRKPVSVATGAAQQVSLMRALDLLFNRTEDFTQAMTATLLIINAASDGAFSDLNAFRFIGDISNISNDRLTGYTHWLGMMIALADPASRAQVLKQFKFTTAFKHPDMTEDGRQRIYHYFVK